MKNKEHLENIENIENYVVVCKKLFFISSFTYEDIKTNSLDAWTWATFRRDFDKSKEKEVKMYKNGTDLPNELKDLYIKYLESKVYKWHRLL
jgi:hypothetical protein